MSPDYKFVISNSTVLPAIERTASFDKDILVREIYSWARDTFDLKRGSYVLFLRSFKKWYKLEPTRKLSRYNLQKDTMSISVKNTVSIDKLQTVREELKHLTEYLMPFGVTHVATKNSQETNNLLVEYSLDFLNQAMLSPNEASF